MAIGGGAVVFYTLDARLPDVFSWQAYTRIAREPSRVYTAGGELLARFGSEIRTVVPRERIPDSLFFALVCAEDAAFFHHPGLDVAGIARAVWVDVLTGRYAQGASTITQQFAKTRYLSAEKTVTRKLKELVLARKLEQKLSKYEILTLYANELYFGHGRYGVEEAARFYFGKSASGLDIAEAAMLAGVVNAPARLSPLRHPEAARRRRAYVLEQMRRRGYINEADATRAGQTPLPTTGTDETRNRLGRWYVEAARREVVERFGNEALRSAGLRIEVALDAEVQRAAEDAVASGLKRVDRRYRSARPLRHYQSEADLLAGLARLERGHRKRPLRTGRVELGVVLRNLPDEAAWEIDLGGTLGRLPWAAVARYADADTGPDAADTGPDAATTAAPIEGWSRGDLLRVSLRTRVGESDTAPGWWLLAPEMGPQAALVALEPQTRLVRALVGGDDFGLHPFDRARQAVRQPGSTFKTFVYGAAMEAGLVTPDTLVVDEKRTYVSHGRPWSPRNYSGDWDGKEHTVRDALARSVNSIAVEVAQRVGPERVADFARRLGITSPLSVDLPLALGASGVRPIELANAYATIAAEGIYATPIFVTRVADKAGQTLFLAPRDGGTRVVSEAVTRALTDMLGEVVRRGSGRHAAVGRPVAGKTGTTNRSRDTWFVGFSPRLVAATWVGHDDRKPMPNGTGGSLALPIWANFMRQALDRVPVLPLPRLPHVLGARAEPQPLETDPEEGASALGDEPLPLAAEAANRPPTSEPGTGTATASGEAGEPSVEDEALESATQ